VLRRDPVQLEQVSKATCDCSDVQTQGVVHELGRLHVRVPHPEAFGDLRNPSAILRLPESVNYGPLQVADVHRLLFAYPVFCRTEEMVRLDQNEAEFGSVRLGTRFVLEAKMTNCAWVTMR